MPEMCVPKRRLGASGPNVPVFSLGSWNVWDRMTRDEAVAMLHRAVDVDAAFFDIGYYNMGPHGEQSRTDILLGEALRDAALPRERYLICGKLWLWNYPDLQFRAQAHNLLERAGLDRFDMVVVGDYYGTPDMHAIINEMNALIDEGIVGAWGTNNWYLPDLQETLRYADESGLVAPSFAQLKYSVVRRAMVEGPGYGALFASGALGLQASDCLEGGILAGRGTPQRKIGADVGGIRERIYEAVPELMRWANHFETTPVALALAYCLANPLTANVLFGASRLEQLNDNLGAIALAQRSGPDIRRALDGLCLDRHVPSEGVVIPPPSSASR